MTPPPPLPQPTTWCLCCQSVAAMRCSRCGGPVCAECDRCCGCRQLVCPRCDQEPTPPFWNDGDAQPHPHTQQGRSALPRGAIREIRCPRRRLASFAPLHDGRAKLVVTYGPYTTRFGVRGVVLCCQECGHVWHAGRAASVAAEAGEIPRAEGVA